VFWTLESIAPAVWSAAFLHIGVYAIAIITHEVRGIPTMLVTFRTVEVCANAFLISATLQVGMVTRVV
jgi:hypothetical protein